MDGKDETPKQPMWRAAAEDPKTSGSSPETATTPFSGTGRTLSGTSNQPRTQSSARPPRNLSRLLSQAQPTRSDKSAVMETQSQNQAQSSSRPQPTRRNSTDWAWSVPPAESEPSASINSPQTQLLSVRDRRSGTAHSSTNNPPQMKPAASKVSTQTQAGPRTPSNSGRLPDQVHPGASGQTDTRKPESQTPPQSNRTGSTDWTWNEPAPVTQPSSSRSILPTQASATSVPQTQPSSRPSNQQQAGAKTHSGPRDDNPGEPGVSKTPARRPSARQPSMSKPPSQDKTISKAQPSTSINKESGKQPAKAPPSSSKPAPRSAKAGASGALPQAAPTASGPPPSLAQLAAERRARRSNTNTSPASDMQASTTVATSSSTSTMSHPIRQAAPQPRPSSSSSYSSRSSSRKSSEPGEGCVDPRDEAWQRRIAEGATIEELFPDLAIDHRVPRQATVPPRPNRRTEQLVADNDFPIPLPRPRGLPEQLSPDHQPLAGLYQNPTVPFYEFQPDDIVPGRPIPATARPPANRLERMYAEMVAANAANPWVPRLRPEHGGVHPHEELLARARRQLELERERERPEYILREGPVPRRRQTEAGHRRRDATIDILHGLPAQARQPEPEHRHRQRPRRPTQPNHPMFDNNRGYVIGLHRGRRPQRDYYDQDDDSGELSADERLPPMRDGRIDPREFQRWADRTNDRERGRRERSGRR